MQFDVKNLLNDQILSEVKISLDIKDTPLQSLAVVPSGKIAFGQVGYSYLSMQFDPQDCLFPTGTFKSKMNFTVIEYDAGSKSEEGSYQEEYVLPGVLITAKDYIHGVPMKVKEFK